MVRTIDLQQESLAMKRLMLSVMALSALTLAGCVVAPARGYYYPHGYYYHPRAVVVVPAPELIVRP
jgi:hypothetical protein